MHIALAFTSSGQEGDVSEILLKLTSTLSIQNSKVDLTIYDQFTQHIPPPTMPDIALKNQASSSKRRYIVARLINSPST